MVRTGSALLVAAVWLLIPSTARATETAGSGIGVAYGYVDGGEWLLRAQFEGDVTDQDINAGTGFLVLAHGMWSPLVLLGDHFRLGPRAALGIKFAEVSASNGAIRLYRFPFDLAGHALVRIQEEAHAVIVGGMTYEMGPTLSGTDEFEAIDVSADNALGWYAEGGLNVLLSGRTTAGAGLEVVVRYTLIDLRLPGAAVDASSIGGVIKLYF